MPPPPKSPLYICRPCLHRLTPRNPPSRALTTTPARRKHGALPTFHPTSSPELSALLSTFRTNIFLPSHLIHAQKTLLYRPKNHALLTNPDEPATVRLGSEVHQLHPLNHLRDEPSTKSSLIKVLELMAKGEDRDWRNLAPFLEGLRTAGRRLGEGQVQKMVRRACEKGRLGVVLDVVRRVEGTGVRLEGVGVVGEVMLGCVGRAMTDSWGAEGVKEGERYARAFWGMLWDERHRVGKPAGEDVRRRVEVVGVVVQMLAVKIRKTGEGSVDELRGLVERLVGCWGWGELDKWGAEEVEERDWSEANTLLVHWAPVWHGMVVARTVLGAESVLGRQLGEKVEAAEAALKRAREVVKRAPDSETRRGVRMYDQLLAEGFS